MKTLDAGQKLTELCKPGRNVAAASMPNLGIQAMEETREWWMENHEIHSSNVESPYPHEDQFIVHFNYDVTNKPMKQRMKLDEMGLFTVRNGKMVKEEFFYTTG